MAEQDSEQDKSESATPFKLSEARKKGMVARSVEVNIAATLLAGLLCITAFSSWCIEHLLRLERDIFLSAGHWQFDAQDVTHRLAAIGRGALDALSPLLALVVLAALAGNLFQVGALFSLEPLKPEFDRLNPATGFKRLFSGRTLFEFIKSVLKLAAFCGVAYLLIDPAFHRLAGLYAVAPAGYPAAFIHEGNHVALGLVAVAIVIGVLDWVYSRWEFARRMRMSRREIREEVKRREGDPQIRSRRRTLQREMRRKASALRRILDSDVLITNPTHYAVALKYRRGEARAPEVLSKGRGALAQRMRAVAFRYRVPIVPNPRLARALYEQTPLGASIDVEHYEVVATILRAVYEQKTRREQGP